MAEPTELDRIWSQTTQNTADIHEMSLRQARIEKLLLDARIERPTRQVGDYLPDPSGVDKAFGAIPDMPLECPEPLAAIRAILSEMLPPSGTPSPAQRLLLRIKAVVG